MAPKPGHHTGADGDGRFIDIKGGCVYARGDAFFGIHDAQAVEATRYLAGIVAEVFRAEPYLRLQDIRVAHKPDSLGPGDPIERFIIIDHRIADVDMQLDLRSR